MAHPRRPAAPGYLIAIGSAVLVTLIRYGLSGILGDTATYTAYIIPVMVAGWYGGLKPALVATVAGSLLCVFFIVPPQFQFAMDSVRPALGLVIFLFCAMIVSALCESLHRAWAAASQQQLQLQEKEALHHDAERRIQTTMENMGDAFHLLDREGRFTFLNAAARRLFTSQGMDPDVLIGAQVWEQFPALLGTPAEAEVRRVLREGTSSAFEFHYLPWKRWFSVRMFPAGGGGLAVHLTDTTDLHRLERDLRDSATQLTLAVEAANISAYEWDIPAGIVTRLSEVPANALLGARYTFAELVDTVHPDDQPSMLARVEATLRGETDVFISEHRSNENPEREWCWHRVRGRLIRDAEGSPQTMIGVSIDISEHKRLEEALREADRRKDNFLATLAHELRNPLAPIRNALHLLRAHAPQVKEIGTSRDVIDRQVTQMARLLDDLLDVSRISRGTLELRREATDLREVLDRALETSHPLIAERKHEVRLDMPEGETLPLHADVIRLAQVFSNLLNNSARYTDSGGIITVRARREGDEAVVSVRDTGIGIEPENLQTVFEMFARAETALRRSSDGLGIGLSLARSIVMLHGGTLEASSAGANQGSEFTARLPLALHRPVAVSEPAAVPEPTSRRNWRLVIADDLRDNTDSLADLLRLQGHEVVTAYDGAEAVDVTERFRPEAVLMDIGMPKLDGFEACRRIRATPWGCDMLIVALTGWGQTVDRERTKAAGFTHHLVKPVDYPTVIAVLNDLRDARAPTGN